MPTVATPTTMASFTVVVRTCTIHAPYIAAATRYTSHGSGESSVSAPQFCEQHLGSILAIPTSFPCRKMSPEKKEQPSLHLASATTTRIGASNPNSGEIRFATCHPIIAQSKSNLVKHSKVGQTVKSGQRLVKREGFNYKYWYFWMSLKNCTIGLKMGYLEN